MPKAVLDTTVLVSALLKRQAGGVSYELLRLADEGALNSSRQKTFSKKPRRSFYGKDATGNATDIRMTMWSSIAGNLPGSRR